MTDFGALTGSYEGAASATAFNRGMSPERMAERAAAYTEIESRNQQLRKLKATAYTDQDLRTLAETQSTELQNLLETQKQMLRENNKKASHTAFERYDVDSDVRHLNTLLSDLKKQGSKLYGNIVRVDKFTENDRQMLTDIGIPPDLVEQIITNPELNKSYVKMTLDNGEVEFGDLDVMKVLTDYNLYATEKELTRQRSARELEQLALMGYDLDPLGREAFRRTRAELGNNVDPKSSEFQNKYSEIYDELQRLKRKGSTTASGVNVYGKPTEREAEAIRRAQLETGMEPTPGDSIWDAAMSRHMSAVNSEYQRPAATRNIEGAEAAKATLDEEGFWEADIDNMSPRERSKWESKIRRIEELSGAGLSQNDRKALSDIQRLTSLGGSASQLTDEQTGIIDNVLRTTKAYIFNEVEGVDATAAYSAYRNLVMHALYGAALTPNEEKNFVKAFGSLSQQRGQVLVKLRTTMQELLDSYQAIVRTNDPYVIQWRTGKTESELLDVVNSLDERINMIKRAEQGLPPLPVATTNVKAAPAEITPESRAILDRIYKGGSGGSK